MTTSSPERYPHLAFEWFYWPILLPFLYPGKIYMNYHVNTHCIHCSSVQIISVLYSEQGSHTTTWKTLKNHSTPVKLEIPWKLKKEQALGDRQSVSKITRIPSVLPYCQEWTRIFYSFSVVSRIVSSTLLSSDFLSVSSCTFSNYWTFLFHNSCSGELYK